MERYDSYKDSGVKWLGEIPSHWEMLALKHILKHKKEVVGKRSSQYDLLSLTLKGVIIRDMDNPEGKFPASFDTYQIVEPNDFIFCNFDNEETPRAVGLSQYKGMITGAYDVLYRNNPLLSDKYLIYYFLYIDDSKRFKPLYKGLRKTVPFDSFMSYKIPVPSRGEQDAVVEYLDAVTSKIDEAIAQQQKMIDLLNERKQIIINNAVTKGLDPNVKMKASGIDWIGDIPEHWEVSRFKSCSFVKANLVHPQNYLSYQQISPECIEKNSGRLIGNKTVADAGVISDNHYFKKGQILYSKIRPALNKAIIAPFDGLCSADMYPIETINHPNFMLYVILSHYFSGQVQLVVNDRVKMPKINKEELGEIVVTYPPKIVEQGVISSYIERELDKIQSVILKYNKQISLLQERKQIIINDVVTGKVKVV